MPEPPDSHSPHSFCLPSPLSVAMAGRALFKNHITIKPVASQATKVSYSGNTMQQKDELGIVPPPLLFLNDTCPRIRRFNSMCQPLTGHLLYANALDVQGPAEGTWAPGALSLAEERGHQQTETSIRIESKANFCLSTPDTRFSRVSG